MASYKYEIVGPDGKPKSGTIEAQNIEIATAELKAGGPSPRARALWMPCRRP